MQEEEGNTPVRGIGFVVVAGIIALSVVGLERANPDKSRFGWRIKLRS